MVWALAWASPAAATHVSCGDSITADTVLDADLRDCPGDGLVIAADGVTVDLAGHEIDGTGSGYGVSPDSAEATRSFVVRNGKIRDFGTGIGGEAEEQSRVRARDVTLVANAAGVGCYFAALCAVESSHIASSSRVAIGVSYGAVRVTDTTIAGNAAGVSLGTGVHGPVRGNSIVTSGAFGLKMHDSGSVEIAENLIADNAGEGVSSLISGELTIMRNRILRNGTGLRMRYASGFSISDNTIAGNRTQGVLVEPDTSGGVSRNSIRDNGGDGVAVHGCSPVEANVLLRNGGDGVSFDPRGEGCITTPRIARNYAFRNGGDGIAVANNGSLVVVERNWARRNGDDGIEIGTPGFNASAPVFSPDGSRYAFLAGQLFTARADGTGLRQLTSFADPSISDVSWAPDGGQLLFIAYPDIWSVGADGTGLRRLTDTGDVLRPSWSPDGATVLFIRFVPGLGRLWLMDADGSNERDIGQTGDHPAFSPDGTRILFLDRRSGDLELWVAGVDGSAALQLTDSPSMEREPQWAPDGAAIAYVRDAGGGGVGDLVIHDLETGTERTVTSGVTRFDWSPDGSELVFDRAGDIFVIGADGANERALVADPGVTERAPSWSADGTLIGYVARIDGDHNTGAIVKPDGSGKRLISYPLTTVSSNRADRNSDLGIEASPYTTDGGGNRAKHNVDARQCVGVVCTK